MVEWTKPVVRAQGLRQVSRQQKLTKSLSLNHIKLEMYRSFMLPENLSMLSVLIYFPVYGYVICDHMRALHVYMSALNGSCPLIGFPCSSYEEFLAGKCVTCKGPFNGTCPQIGNDELAECFKGKLFKDKYLKYLVCLWTPISNF